MYHPYPVRKESGHLSINEKRDDTLEEGEGLDHLDGPENAKAPSDQEQPPQSVAMRYFNAGDILMELCDISTQPSPTRSDSLKRRYVGIRLCGSRVLFLLIWLFATVSTIGH